MSNMELKVELPFRILVDVTFHYNESRLQYLFQVVRAFSEYPIETTDIVIVTNVDDQSKLQKILSVCAPLVERHPTRRDSNKTLSIESFPNLPDPWHLPWCHKGLIADRFLNAEMGYTHYIHVEDDILLSFDNFCYFVRYRDLLRGQRLIPSFFRVEFNSKDNRLYLADQIGVSDFPSRKAINLDGFSFVNPDYPHNAMFILDQDLAMEYVQTSSFDRERSRELRPQWGLCERASMGLCFERPPEGFSYRYVIPVNPDTLKTPNWSWVYHIPNNYVTNLRQPLGKTQTDQIFSNDKSVVRWSPPTKLENIIWHLKRLAKRLRHGRGPGTGHDLVPRRLCALCGLKKEESNHCSNRSCPAKMIWGA